MGSVSNAVETIGVFRYEDTFFVHVALSRLDGKVGLDLPSAQREITQVPQSGCSPSSKRTELQLNIRRELGEAVIF